MSHDQLGPHEQRLRELREARMRRANPPRKLIPYAGKDPKGQPAGAFRTNGPKKGKKT